MLAHQIIASSFLQEVMPSERALIQIVCPLTEIVFVLLDRDMDNSLMGRVCHSLHRLETFTFIGNTGSMVKEELITDPRAQVPFNKT